MGKIDKMSQPTYKSPHTNSQNKPYYWFLTYTSLPIVADKFRESSLEELATDEDGGKFLKDRRALWKSSTQHSYAELEERLVGSFKAFGSNQTYASSIKSEIDDRFSSIFTYIKIMDERFNLDSKKVKKLKSALIRTFIEKLDGSPYKPLWYIPKGEKKLYETLQKKYDKEKNDRRSGQAHLPPQQHL